MIKNAPKTIDQKSCKYIFNNISETADVPENYPKHLKRSKDYHQTYDLTLLSTIRKILAAFILSRIKARVNNKIPSTILTL